MVYLGMDSLYSNDHRLSIYYGAHEQRKLCNKRSQRVAERAILPIRQIPIYMHDPFKTFNTSAYHIMYLLR